MIKWTSPDKKKPPVDQDDAWNKENRVSPRLLVAFISQHTKTEHISFGNYFHKTDHWSVEGYTGGKTVVAWSVVNFPV